MVNLSVLGGTGVLIGFFAACGSAAEPSRPLHLEVRIASPLDEGRQPLTAMVGDRLLARGDAAEHVWVYRARNTLAARCPGEVSPPLTCTPGARGVELTFRFDVAARYHVLAVDGPADLVPTGDLDGDVLEARARGAHLELHAIQVGPAITPSP